ncbi:polysaccharide deacetylase family protein [Kaistella jeonii]|uniref:Polysaccharide deacetylase n=1 Tax=Kaistella jeonii TaxID=266749 RepID=A0A0C1D4P4_9FLAO|nr:polysaccharide deacetylase family protein [Kaistella jeonii]KIA88715.1 polysaccharide deacetylase [Kaistella jeonii]SFC10719.1 Polysaccharide deacetylase [Kaistella jeonii]VEI95294.1 polysaccharide deacetylase family sporulation protein PdaB [Kaistella jeonii]
MILLTFNITNNRSDFEKNYDLTDEEILKITEQNTSSILRTLENNNVLATFFVEVSIVEKLKPLIKKIIGKGHEIAFYNENSSLLEIETAKGSIEENINKIIRGIRQKEVSLSIEELKKLEFTYISNIENADILFPFKRLKRSTQILQKSGLSIIPESISPYSQIPYNDFVFQALPLQYYKSMVLETMKNDDFVLVYINSWQFTNFGKFHFKIPFYRKYNSGRKMDDKLENFLRWINDENLAFSRMKDFIF